MGPSASSASGSSSSRSRFLLSRSRLRRLEFPPGRFAPNSSSVSSSHLVMLSTASTMSWMISGGSELSVAIDARVARVTSSSREARAFGSVALFQVCCERRVVEVNRSVVEERECSASSTFSSLHLASIAVAPNRSVMAPSPLAIPLMADAPSPLPPLPSSISSSPSSWIPVHATTASVASAECFVAALVELVHYPERSSSTILRADILVDHDFQHDLSASDATGKGKARATESPFDVDGYQLTRRIRRKILPKRPQFDHAMEQECLFYSRQHAPTTVLDEGLIRDKETLVLFVVDLDLLEKETGKREPPYYHPQVSTLAFRYLPACLTPRPGASPSSPTLRIDLVPLPESQIHAPLEPQDRLFRTSMMLLRSIDKVMKGSANGYEKRVHHDLLVAKERVQDVYQGLKSKYSCVFQIVSLFFAFASWSVLARVSRAGSDTRIALRTGESSHAIKIIDDPSPRITFPRFLAATWAEKTDPSKHVFEDVAICAWLMCLWETMYPPRLSDRDGVERAEPEGGFCDVGCGNGLL